LGRGRLHYGMSQDADRNLRTAAGNCAFYRELVLLKSGIVFLSKYDRSFLQRPNLNLINHAQLGWIR